MAGMTSRIRIITYVTAATLVVATTVGCGLLSAAKKLAGNVATISEFSQKIQNGLTLTYRADYKDSDGTTVTVQQQPPNSVFISKTGPLIFANNTTYLCDNSSGTMTCDKTVNTSSADAEATLAASSFAAGGFMAGEAGVLLLIAASVVPSAKVSKSTKKVAGQNSSCVNVTNLSDTQSGNTDFTAFSMCITDSGVVSEFSGTDSNGKVEGSTMTSYSTHIDPSLFEPPAGAVINDTSQLPGDTTSPSPSPSSS